MGDYDESFEISFFFNVNIIIRYLNSFRTIKSIYDLLENLSPELIYQLSFLLFSDKREAIALIHLLIMYN